jgi:hypothetical protein
LERANEQARRQPDENTFLSMVARAAHAAGTSVAGFVKGDRQKAARQLEFPQLSAADAKVARDMEQGLGNLDIVLAGGAFA